jgi:hypothetical protein
MSCKHVLPPIYFDELQRHNNRSSDKSCCDYNMPANYRAVPVNKNIAHLQRTSCGADTCTMTDVKDDSKCMMVETMHLMHFCAIYYIEKNASPYTWITHVCIDAAAARRVGDTVWLVFDR